MTDPDNDFERRVTDALESGAEEAPDTTGLVVAARRRARVRRRVRGGVVAGLVVAAIAVPAGVAALGGDSPGDRNDVASDPSTSASVDPEPTVPDGWQVERWKGLEVAVPGDWTPGARSSWCVDGRPEEGRVDRPTDDVLHIVCGDPAYSFGLTFGSSAAYDTVYESGRIWRYTLGDQEAIEQFVPGSWLGHWYDGTRLVQVNAADRETVQQVLDSLEVSTAG